MLTSSPKDEGDNNAMTTVQMTRHDAALFLLFQQYYDDFGFMMESGVWDIRNGKATLHFDEGGRLKNIKRELWTYANSYPQDFAQGY
jgi:hypothetical protein